MTKHLKKASKHVYVGAGLLLILVIVAVEAIHTAAPLRDSPRHTAAPTYTVCHATGEYDERYYCSTEGCISDAEWKVTVVGTYEDAAMCSGIAERLEGKL